MSRRTMILLACVVLAATTAIAGTLAWLTDAEYDVNVMTMGSVQIEQDEYGSLTDTNIPYQDTGLMPGKTVIKNVEVKNTGASDAYVRTVVAVEWPSTFDGSEIELKWADGVAATAVDGVATIDNIPYKLYYVDYELAAGATNKDLLESVTLTGNADNADLEAIDDTLLVLVASQAVQTEGFDTIADAMAGSWYEQPISSTNHPWVNGLEQDGKKTISSANELKAFADEVNGGNNYEGKTIVLLNNIDLSGMDWTPIGNDSDGWNKAFCGTFDGQGYSITGLKVKGTDSVGLFGVTKGTVRNLTVDGATVEGNHYVGGVVGYAYGTIENCRVKNSTLVNTHTDDDNCGDKTGAVVGYLGEDATLRKCTADTCDVNGSRDAGQVVGAAKASCVSECTATNTTVKYYDSGCTHINKEGNIRAEVIGREL